MVWALIVLSIISGNLSGWMSSGHKTQTECFEQADWSAPWSDPSVVYWNCIQTDNPSETFDKILYGTP